MQTNTQILYRPDIDGLRAIAVILVIAFHLFPSHLPGGFIGVDIFFVISGYLISKIILNKGYKNYSELGLFYISRIKRLFPSLIFLLFSLLIFGYFFLYPEEYKLLGKHIFYSSFYLLNFTLYFESGYFDIASKYKILLNLWSLSVEEQFYLIWPILFLLIIKTKKRYIFSLLLIVSSVLAAIVAISKPMLVFYMTPFRIWEFALGASVSIFYKDYFESKDITNNNILSVIGFILILISVLYIREYRLYNFYLMIIPCIGSLLIIITKDSYINVNILTKSPLVFIGLISYPLYLWHWPIISIANIASGKPLMMFEVAIILLLTFCISCFSYFIIEKPIREGANVLWKIVLLISILVGTCGAFIFVNDGKVNRPFTVNSEILRAQSDWNFPGDLKPIRLKSDNILFYTNSEYPIEVLFIGDSHVQQFGPVLAAKNNYSSFKSAGMIFSTGCPAIPNVHEGMHPDCDNLLARVDKLLKYYPSIKTIVIGGCWNCYLIGETQTGLGSSNYNYYYQDNSEKKLFKGGDGANLAILSLRNYVSELSKNYEVFLILDNPKDSQLNPKSYLVNSNGFKNRLNIYSQNKSHESLLDLKPILLSEDIKLLNNRLRLEVRAVGVNFIDQLEVLCPNNLCMVAYDGSMIYMDGEHLTSGYVSKNIKYFDKILKR